MSKRDKVIRVRVSPSEHLQISRYFQSTGENMSDHVRKYLLELTHEYELDTTNQADIFQLFQAFLSDDEVAKEIFNKFATSTGLLDCDYNVDTDGAIDENGYNEETGRVYFYQGLYYTADELEDMARGMSQE